MQCSVGQFSAVQCSVAHCTARQFLTQEEWDKSDLLSMMTEVSRQVATEKAQIPCVTSMLTRKIVLSDNNQKPPEQIAQGLADSIHMHIHMQKAHELTEMNIHSKALQEELNRTKQALNKVMQMQTEMLKEMKLCPDITKHLETEDEGERLDEEKLSNTQQDVSPEVSTGPRLAFLIANTYENSECQKDLLSTEQSMENVKTALERHRFNPKLHINESFDTIKMKLEAWKKDALKDGNPEVLLFYFCGHGGIIEMVTVSYHIDFNLFRPPSL